MSNMYLTRRIFTDKSTIGKLIFNELELWTLEDTCRDPNKNGVYDAGEKVYGLTAIPSGSYKVEMRMSKKYQRLMPYLCNVPFYEGIMIHPGNFPADTNGCILVGLGHTIVDKIDEGKKAFEKLYPLITEACSKGNLKINIAGGFGIRD